MLSIFKNVSSSNVIYISLTRLLRTKYYIRQFRNEEVTVPKRFKTWVQNCPNKVAISYKDEEWTYEELDTFSNKVANVLLNCGLKVGDEISLFMTPKPEYVGFWLGAAKTGIITALINTNQKDETLLHSITTVNSKAVIFGNELQQSIKQIYETIRENKNIQLFCYGDFDSKTLPVKNMNRLIEDSSDDDPVHLDNGKFTDRLFYVYTSGTTGMPKAVIIKHSRYLYLSSVVRNLLLLRDDDVVYTVIPLYHMAGGCIGTGLCLVWGNSIVIRSSFSASNFWKDCVKYKCTIAQYVGELCRYLLLQPKSEFDSTHKVRLMFGNGLRPNIWKEFQERFQIETIGEFYGASEGNSNVINMDNTVGSCGFISQLLPGRITDFFFPVSLIRVNEETGEAIRGPDGLCVRCQPNQCGEFIGKIVKEDPTREFDGYLNTEATNKKIIRDVYRKGDMYFRSGDLLYLDQFGYVFFKDRTGDTYRWKGENVSTTEVEEVISKIIKHRDCIVYGVEIPGCEGRAGMVAIAGDTTVEMDKLYIKLGNKLPKYAIPVFVRLTEKIELTGTFKMSKTVLQKQAFNPTITDDQIFVIDTNKNGYVKMDRYLYEDIINSQLTF
ncbi:Long-chain fatty acid transport protein 1-like protein [Leptotrombidium deliense]|uniref:Very long-chain fatty acid transport protein n=1 Tax=Leptotrombidium deliense TaxID=299467 RepID=A0A443SNU4_9ACAR|nr:Long-chain fatty acid transport protein 1-like protein [Leptotrombidium deliense]